MVLAFLMCALHIVDHKWFGRSDSQYWSGLWPTWTTFEPLRCLGLTSRSFHCASGFSRSSTNLNDIALTGTEIFETM